MLPIIIKLVGVKKSHNYQNKVFENSKLIESYYEKLS